MDGCDLVLRGIPTAGNPGPKIDLSHNHFRKWEYFLELEVWYDMN
jgi:hypothetical protein